jgi:hypothetical protein
MIRTEADFIMRAGTGMHDFWHCHMKADPGGHISVTGEW